MLCGSTKARLLWPGALHPLLTGSVHPLQEEARADVVDSAVRDIQNTQCLLNVEYVGPSCTHVTLQFADSKADVGLGLVKTGLVMVEPRKEKQFQKVVSPVGGRGRDLGGGRGSGARGL